MKQICRQCSCVQLHCLHQAQILERVRRAYQDFGDDDVLVGCGTSRRIGTEADVLGGGWWVSEQRQQCRGMWKMKYRVTDVSVRA